MGLQQHQNTDLGALYRSKRNTSITLAVAGAMPVRLARQNGERARL